MLTNFFTAFKQCDAIKISEEVNRYNALIEGGSIAFTHFATLGQMTAL